MLKNLSLKGAYRISYILYFSHNLCGYLEMEPYPYPVLFLFICIASNGDMMMRQTQVYL